MLSFSSFRCFSPRWIDYTKQRTCKIIFSTSGFFSIPEQPIQQYLLWPLIILDISIFFSCVVSSYFSALLSTKSSSNSKFWVTKSTTLNHLRMHFFNTTKFALQMLTHSFNFFFKIMRSFLCFYVPFVIFITELSFHIYYRG